MTERNDGDQHRPFDDPRHPSWYSDSSAGPADSESPAAGTRPGPQNPYADQPLNGPYGDGRPQYPIDGGYPVRTNDPGARPEDHSPHAGAGASPWERQEAPARQAGAPYPTGQYSGGPYGEEPASGVAIASMVLGIIGVVTGGFIVIPQILAIILGHMGLKRNRASRGFSIAGLVMGYLVTALMLLAIVGFIIFMTLALGAAESSTYSY